MLTYADVCRGAGGGGGSVAYKSVSATFKTDLSSLMEVRIVKAGDPHLKLIAYEAFSYQCVKP